LERILASYMILFPRN